ncbi:1167_t:CDS:2, partial [Cetraspora pellucida]
ILYDHKCGDSLATIVKNIKCSKTTVHKTLKWYAQTGSTMPRKRPDPKAIFNESALEELRKMVIQDTKHPEEFDESCLVPTVGHSPSLMFWKCFSWHRLEPIVPIRSTINGEVYTKLIRRHAISAICQLVSNGQDLPTSIEDLEIKVKAAWYSIPPKCYRKLSNSMIRRVKACYGADGGPIDF